MANTAHLVRRQSSMDLHHQRSLDRLELREIRGRLVDGPTAAKAQPITYGATNMAFEDTSPNTQAQVCFFFYSKKIYWKTRRTISYIRESSSMFLWISSC